MRRKIATMLLLAVLTITCQAKDVKTVVFTLSPQMHCETCETKIKSNIRFEKGVKKIETDIKAQTVTIQYDAEKTSPEKIADGFKKIGYDAVPKTDN